MALWNAVLAAGWRTVFYPTVGAALATRCHWLHVVCPACQQMGETEIDIHPNASLGTVGRHVFQAMFAASDVREAARCHAGHVCLWKRADIGASNALLMAIR